MFCIVSYLRQKPLLTLLFLSFSSILLMPYLATSFRSISSNIIRRFSVAAMDSAQVNEVLTNNVKTILLILIEA